MKNKHEIFTEKEKIAFKKAKDKMLQQIENLWVDYILTIEELRKIQISQTK